MKLYQVYMEVEGPAAMFARPDTGSAPTSYPAPTWSAAKAMFEAIAFFADGAAWVCPTKVEICRRIGDPGAGVQYQSLTMNYGGPLRKADLFRKGTVSGGSSMQLFATIVTNVCYRLHGTVLAKRADNGGNPKHHLKNLFDRRLTRGQCFRTPCLGWSEFVCTYWGPFRKQVTEVDTTISLEVPSMLFSVWDAPSSGNYAPAFHQNVTIDAGVLAYDISSIRLHDSSLKE